MHDAILKPSKDRNVDAGKDRGCGKSPQEAGMANASLSLLAQSGQRNAKN
jgi:hypothetical protein